VPNRYLLRFHFGPYTLDPLSGILCKGGRRLRADLRLVRFLAAIVERKGKTVSREFLERKFWPSLSARDLNLDVLVCQARKLLGDDPRAPRFIQTRRLEGYRFICPVRQIPVPAEENAGRSKAIAFCEKAHHRWALRTPSAIKESILLYSRAIKEDPTCAMAWSGRADAWTMAGIHCLLPPADAFLRARSDAADALRIAPKLAEAIVSEAWVKLCYDREFTKAKRDFSRALRLNPKNPFAYNGLALLYIGLGKPGRAAKAMLKAWELKAASAFLNALLADALYQDHNYDKAAERAKLALHSDPGFAVGHACLGKVYLQQGKLEEAIGHLELACRLSGGSPIMLGLLAYAYGTSRQKEKATGILRRLSKQRRDNNDYVSPYFLALAELGLRRCWRAVHYLRQAFRERSHWVLFLRTEPTLDSLRGDKRFQALLKDL